MSGNDEKNDSLFRLTIVNMLAGGTAGILSDSLFYQLEVFKTRRQVMLDKTELPALRSRYQGFGLNALMAFPSNGAYFSGFVLGKRLYQLVFGKKESDSKKFCLGESLTGGVLSEFMSNLIRTPLEKIKTRIQAGEKIKLFPALRELYASGGIRRVYAGWWALMGRDVPFSMAQFACYDFLRGSDSWLSGQTNEVSLIRGLICGLVAVVCSHPADVVKTLVFTQSEPARSMPQLALAVFHKQGISGFFKGVGFRAAYVGASTALLFGLYDSLVAKFEPLVKF